METEVEVGSGRAFEQAERIQVCAEVAARTVGRDQLADRAFARVATAGSRRRLSALGGAGDGMDHRRMGDVTGLATLEGVEICLPFRTHALGRDQILLIQVFDVGRVRAELRRLGELLQETVHNGNGILEWGRRNRLIASLDRCSGAQDPEL